MLRQSLVGFILKVGLSVSLLFAALYSFFRPIEAVVYYPSFLVQGIDDRGIVYFISLLILLLIVWIFSGKQKFASSLTVTILIGIVALINIKNVAFLFHLIPTFCIALALVFRYYPRIRVIAENSPSSNVAHVFIHEESFNDIADDEDGLEDIDNPDVESEDIIDAIEKFDE